MARTSVRETLGRAAGEPEPARLANWRRRWSIARDNHRTEKEFAPLAGEPFDWCLGLNLEPAPGNEEPEWPNGALIEVDDEALTRLRGREIRYEPVEVTADVRGAAAAFDRVVAFVARPANLSLEPPPRAVVIASYLATVEAAFAELGPGEADAFARSTGPVPVPVVEARLVRDEIPAGNPREW